MAGRTAIPDDALAPERPHRSTLTDDAGLAQLAPDRTNGSPVAGALSNLQAAVERHEHKIHLLLDRLVLLTHAGEGPVTGRPDSTTPHGPRSSIVNEIEGRAEQLRLLTDLVEDILARLDL
jgi:hypothetical protein